MALAPVQEVTIETIAAVTETRDPETGGHIKRTQHYVKAVADVYDALISKRVYKKSMDHQDVVQIIVSEKETHFDPALVDVFLDVQDSFVVIKNRFEDPVD